MHKILSIVLAAAFLIFAAAGATAEGQVFGKGVSLEKAVKVSDLLENPDKYVGETIRVEGIAVGVCSHRGCWVELASDKEGDTVRVKVKDGEIVFPPELLGSVLAAEGVWTANKLDLDTTKQLCEHKAKQAGENFDSEKVTECMTLYQISGTGAMVMDMPQKSLKKG
ncbi:DUF4920 domain-containing protein [bacterium]|nr:DUF4920 domain-containing protein [bacterium]